MTTSTARARAIRRRSGEIWLGDAVLAVDALSADPDAARAIVAMLGLPLAEVVAMPPTGTGAVPRPPVPLPHRDGAPPPGGGDGDGDGDDGAAASAPASTAPDDPGHRLPSRLDALASRATPAPSWLASQPPLRVDAERPDRPPPPLLPRRSQRPILTAALSTWVDEGEPDLRRIVAEMARGRPPKRIPRLARRTLRHGVELRIDRAPWLAVFHDDQTRLHETLRQLLPRDRIRTVVIDGSPQPVVPPRARAARRGQPRAASMSTTGGPGPRAPTPLLVVSDLGAGWRGDGRAPAPASAWAEFFAGVVRERRHAVVLTPWGGDGLQAPPGVAVLHWAERTTLGDALRARAGQRPPTPQRIGGDQLLALARQISPALVAGAALLRETRLSLHLDPAAEAELVASELVASHGRSGVVLDAGAAATLRAELAASGDLDAALARCAAHRGGRVDGAAIEETLIAIELRGGIDDDSVADALRPAIKSLASGAAAAGAVASWAAHAWSRFSDAVRETPAARQLAYAAARHVGQSSWLVDGDDRRPALPADSAWLFAGSRRAVFSLEWRRYGDGTTNLVFGPEQPSTNALHRIALDGGDGPVWVEVVERPDSGDDGPRQTVALSESQPTQVQLDAGIVTGAGSVEIVGLGGERWRSAPSRSVAEMLHGAIWVGAISGASRAGPWEWIVGVVVIDERRALIPLRSDDDSFTGVGLGDVKRRMTLLHPADGAQVDVGIVDRVRLQAVDAWLVERVDGRGGPAKPPAPPAWQPLDGSCWPAVGDDPAVDPETTHLLIPLAGGREFAAIGLRRSAAAQRPVYELDGPIADEAAPALLIALSGGDWELVSRVERLSGPAPETSPTQSLQPPTKAAKGSPRSQKSTRPVGGVETSAVLVESRSWPQVVVEIDQLAMPAASVPRPSGGALAPPSPPRSSLRSRFIALIENREDTEVGLFDVDLDPVFALRRADPASLESLAAERPLLLLIHGVSGDTRSNFGGLLEAPGDDRSRLAEHYRDGIVAWQYRSLTTGPLRNAVALMQALPPGARLHLLAQSAGGLVGELLCRGMRDGEPFDRGDIERLAAQSSVEPDAVALLVELSKLLQDKRPVIERFVRIAAPIEGSTIYAAGARTTGRIARAMPLVGGVLSLLPGVESLLTDPTLVPGPAALVPGASVQPLLTSDVVVDAPLTVITGVVEQPSLMGRIGAWVLRGGDRDPGPPSDGWVSLASAFGGMERRGGVDYLVERGPDVDHAGYTKQPRVRRAIVDALLATSTPAPGYAHESTLAELQRRHRSRSADRGDGSAAMA